uniref:Uncharacterized protein n=1 Tax=Heterorhabditis bacteriophora TaxID=37862 RepID=A0A1I7WGS5_HETBA
MQLQRIQSTHYYMRLFSLVDYQTNDSMDGEYSTRCRDDRFVSSADVLSRDVNREVHCLAV